MYLYPRNKSQTMPPISHLSASERGIQDLLVYIILYTFHFNLFFQSNQMSFFQKFLSKCVFLFYDIKKLHIVFCTLYFFTKHNAIIIQNIITQLYINLAILSKHQPEGCAKTGSMVEINFKRYSLSLSHSHSCQREKKNM